MFWGPDLDLALRTYDLFYMTFVPPRWLLTQLRQFKFQECIEIPYVLTVFCQLLLWHTIYQTQSITRLLESFGYLLTLFFVTKVQILKHKLLILLLFIHWIFKFCNWWDMQWIFVDGSFEIVSFLNKPWATVYILGQ